MSKRSRGSCHDGASSDGVSSDDVVSDHPKRKTTTHCKPQSDYKCIVTVGKTYVARAYKTSVEIFVGMNVHETSFTLTPVDFSSKSSKKTLDETWFDCADAICGLINDMIDTHAFFSHPIIAIVCEDKYGVEKLFSVIDAKFEGERCPCIVVTNAVTSKDAHANRKVSVALSSTDGQAKWMEMPRRGNYSAEYPWGTRGEMEDYRFNCTITILASKSKSKSKITNTSMLTEGAAEHNFKVEVERQIQSSDDLRFIVSNFHKAAQFQPMRIKLKNSRRPPMVETCISRELTPSIIGIAHKRMKGKVRNIGNRFVGMTQVAEFISDAVFRHNKKAECHNTFFCIQCQPYRVGTCVSFLDCVGAQHVQRYGRIVVNCDTLDPITREAKVRVEVILAKFSKGEVVSHDGTQYMVKETVFTHFSRGWQYGLSDDGSAEMVKMVKQAELKMAKDVSLVSKMRSVPESCLTFCDDNVATKLEERSRRCDFCPHKICSKTCVCMTRWENSAHTVTDLVVGTMQELADIPTPADVPDRIVRMVIEGVASLVMASKRIYELLDVLSERYRALHDLHLILGVSDTPMFHQIEALVPRVWVGGRQSHTKRIYEIDTEIALPTNDRWLAIMCSETNMFSIRKPNQTKEQKRAEPYEGFTSKEKVEAVEFFTDSRQNPHLHQLLLKALGGDYSNVGNIEKLWGKGGELVPTLLQFFTLELVEMQVQVYGTHDSRRRLIKGLRSQYARNNQRTLEAQLEYSLRISSGAIAPDDIHEDDVYSVEYHEDPVREHGLRKLEMKRSKLKAYLADNEEILQKVFRKMDPFGTEYAEYAFFIDEADYDTIADDANREKQKILDYCVMNANRILSWKNPVGPRECVLEPSFKTTLSEVLNDIDRACSDGKGDLDFSRPAKDRFDPRHLESSKLEWWKTANQWSDLRARAKEIDKNPVRLFQDAPHPKFRRGTNKHLIEQQRYDPHLLKNEENIWYHEEDSTLAAVTAHNEPLARSLTVGKLRERLDSSYYYRYWYELYTDICWMLDTEKTYLMALKKSFASTKARRMKALSTLWAKLDADFEATVEMQDNRAQMQRATWHRQSPTDEHGKKRPIGVLRKRWLPWRDNARDSDGLPRAMTCYDRSDPNLSNYRAQPTDVCSPRHWFLNVGITLIMRRMFWDEDHSVVQHAWPSFQASLMKSAHEHMFRMIQSFLRKTDDGKYEFMPGCPDRKIRTRVRRARAEGIDFQVDCEWDRGQSNKAAHPEEVNDPQLPASTDICGAVSSYCTTPHGPNPHGLNPSKALLRVRKEQDQQDKKQQQQYGL